MKRTYGHVPQDGLDDDACAPLAQTMYDRGSAEIMNSLDDAALSVFTTISRWPDPSEHTRTTSLKVPLCGFHFSYQHKWYAMVFKSPSMQPLTFSPVVSDSL